MGVPFSVDSKNIRYSLFTYIIHKLIYIAIAIKVVHHLYVRDHQNHGILVHIQPPLPKRQIKKFPFTIPILFLLDKSVIQTHFYRIHLKFSPVYFEVLLPLQNRCWSPLRDILLFLPQWFLALGILAAYICLTMLLPIGDCPT